MESMNNSNQNVKQKTFWSGKGGDVWVERQTELDITLEPLGNAALEKIDLTNSNQLLDIGCGTGRTCIDIAQKFSNCHVSGIDISVPMIGRAKNLANDEKILNASFLVQDIQLEPLEADKYDAAFSRFGVMFFDEPKEAFINIHNSLKDNSPLSFVCWQSPKVNPWHGVASLVLKQHLDLPVPEKRAPSPFAFQEQDYIDDILTTAGFKNIMIEPLALKILWFADQSLDEAVFNFMSLNPVIAESMKSVEAETKDKITNELSEAFKPFMTDKGLVFDSATWIVSANK